MKSLAARGFDLPLYEYRCRKCGATVEKIQKFSDRPLSKCEKCGGKLDRLISSPAIQFKGTGWYVTDYARKSTPESAAAPTTAGEKTEKTEKTPAGKSDGSSAKETKKPAESSTPKK